MPDEKDYQEKLFKAFITMLSNSVLQHLGKTMNLFTAKIEPNLEAAKATLDILEMLRIKTRGNLNREEEELLNTTVNHLQMNYTEESREEKSNGMEGRDTKKK